MTWSNATDSEVMYNGSKEVNVEGHERKHDKNIVPWTGINIRSSIIRSATFRLVVCNVLGQKSRYSGNQITGIIHRQNPDTTGSGTSYV